MEWSKREKQKSLELWSSLTDIQKIIVYQATLIYSKHPKPIPPSHFLEIFKIFMRVINEK